MSTRAAIRVLVADDSALMRRILRRIIEDDSELELIDTARDGEDVVLKARELRPDVVSMDINMPKLDGISALQILVAEEICPVVMLSSLTQRGVATTFEALELGAFDYVAKPDGTVSDLGSVAGELCAKLKAAAAGGTLGRLRRKVRTRSRRQPSPPSVAEASPNVERAPRFDTKAIAIGISTGGPSTILDVIPLLPASLNAVVFLVQHMPATFTNAFAKRLDAASALTVVEASAGMEVRPGYCYVARGDYHMTVHRNSAGTTLLRTPTTPETLFRPSVNVMMESVVRAFGRNTIGVLMTGIGDDGADQMVQIRAVGGYTIAESEESSVVFGMPREAIERGGADEVRPSWEVAKAILRRC
jgi:two-component system, chemotaxis family, protein-glutamate methylesterase/glutaminase